MSISSLSALAIAIKSKWQIQIVQGRPSDQAQLQAHIGNVVTYSSISSQFDEWIKSLSTLGSKPRVSATISKPLMQAAMQCLNALSIALDSANNGVDWICTQRSFAVNLTLAGFLIREITSEQRRETTAIIDAAKDRIEKDMSFLQQGSTYAQNLVGNKTEIDAQLETLSNANDTVTEKLSELQKSKVIPPQINNS